MRDTGLQVRPGRAGRRPAGRRAPAAGDPEGAVPRRAHPDPRRADRGADAAGDRAAVRHAAQPARARHDDPADHAQAQGDHGAVRRGDGDARRRAWCSTAPIADTSIDALAQAMVGRRVQLGRAGAARAHAARRRGRCCRPRPRAGATRWACARLADVSLTLRAGEIVGIAGVSGNGQSELLDALAGPAGAAAPARCRSAAATFTPRALARPGARARAAHRARARRSPPARPGAALRGLGVGGARLPATRRATAARGWMQPGAMRGRHRADDGALRRAPARPAAALVASSPAATSRSSCWRARRCREPQRAAGRPADARRRHRRDRVHPRPLARDARRRRRGAGGVVASSTRSSRWPTACW